MELKINHTLASIAVTTAAHHVKNPYCAAYCGAWRGEESAYDRAQALYIACNGPFKGQDAKLARKILLAYGQRKATLKIKPEELCSWADWSV